MAQRRVLRLGQAVRARDGSVGVVVDIVVDPHRRTMTNLVVEPHHLQQLDRLVPLAAVRSVGETVHLDLTKAEVRALPLVTREEIIGSGHIHGDRDWDAGAATIVALPYYGPDMTSMLFDGIVDVTYHRIPKGECELRRRSVVTASDGPVVGRIEGVVLEGHRLSTVVVRVGHVGRRAYVAVPIASVADIHTDRISLSIDEARFDAIPRVHDPDAATGDAAA